VPLSIEARSGGLQAKTACRAGLALASDLAFQDDQLLAKDEIFKHQAALPTNNAKNGAQPEPEQVKHGSRFIADRLAG